LPLLLPSGLSNHKKRKLKSQKRL